MGAEYLSLHERLGADSRTDCGDEHGQAPEGGDGVREVLLRVVELLDVAADVLRGR